MRWVCLAAIALTGCRLAELVQTPDAAGQLRFSVQPSHADSGRSITPPVQVTVLDASSAPDTLFRQTVTVVLAHNPGGAALSGTTVATVVRGVATFPTLRLDRPGAGYVLLASASARSAVKSNAFDVTNLPPLPAKRLEFSVQPVTTLANAAIAPPVLVTARDTLGRVVTAYSGTITVRLGANAAGGVLSGTLTAAASNGVATFATLRIDRGGSGFTLTAAASGLTGGTSAAFSITAPPVTQLVFTVQPANARVTRKIEPPLVVTALDASGLPVKSFTGAITIALVANSYGAKVSGSLTVNAVSGAATFDNVRIDKMGIDYQLRAMSATPALNVTSNPFTVGL